jgi:hypothetical protein
VGAWPFTGLKAFIIATQQALDSVRRLDAVVADARAQVARARATVEQARQAVRRSRRTVTESRQMVSGIQLAHDLRSRPHR